MSYFANTQLRRLGPSVLAVALAISMGTAISHADDGGNKGNNTEVRLRTKLAGGAISGKTPSGDADFRMQGSRTRLNVEVEDVNLPAATMLTVVVTHAGAPTTVGTITLSSSGEAELELDSQHGDTVPSIVKGDMIAVMNGTAAVVSGVF